MKVNELLEAASGDKAAMTKVIKKLSDDSGDIHNPGPQKLIPHDARFKDVDYSFDEKTLWWVTQGSEYEQNGDVARAIARELSKAGFNGWTVKVALRDDWDGTDAGTRWRKAKSR